jgi:hypothetical protein
MTTKKKAKPKAKEKPKAKMKNALAMNHPPPIIKEKLRSLPVLKGVITTSLEQQTHGRDSWTTATVNLAVALAEARMQFPDNQGFGKWLGVSGFKEIKETDRAALIKMGRQPDIAREVIAASISNSVQRLVIDFNVKMEQVMPKAEVDVEKRKAKNKAKNNRTPEPRHVDKSGNAKPAPMTPKKKPQTIDASYHVIEGAAPVVGTRVRAPTALEVCRKAFDDVCNMIGDLDPEGRDIMLDLIKNFLADVA